jgi:putative oxygen-independent coproporphyrinogen III oxidase
MVSFGLYIHWPFCLSKCPYCDFNSHVREKIDEQSWEIGLIHELKRYHQLTPNHHLKTIFFGGGTPSLMSPITVEKIIHSAKTLWAHDDDLEISLEANPNSVEVQKFKSLRDAGVNRVSIGVQSLVPSDLKALGRQHSTDDALNAISVAQQYFPRYSFDLIYAREHQKLSDWETELSKAISYAGNHLSLYQLTIEPGTLFEKRHKRGELIIPEEQDAYDFYALTQEIMTSHGFESYEVSNYARSNDACRHNMIYWQYDDYIGVGPGAHGRVTINGIKHATRQVRAPEAWLKQIQNEHHGDAEFTILSLEETLEEKLMMGLRISNGVNFLSVADIIEKPRLDTLITEDFLQMNNGQIVATAKGRMCLNSVTSYILK